MTKITNLANHSLAKRIDELAAKIASGFYAINLPVDELEALISRMEERVKQAQFDEWLKYGEDPPEGNPL